MSNCYLFMANNFFESKTTNSGGYTTAKNVSNGAVIIMGWTSTFMCFCASFATCWWHSDSLNSEETSLWKHLVWNPSLSRYFWLFVWRHLGLGHIKMFKYISSLNQSILRSTLGSDIGSDFCDCLPTKKKKYWNIELLEMCIRKKPNIPNLLWVVYFIRKCI